MPFENRADAATVLVERLAKYRGLRPVVLAIPRGAVPMGHIIADGLGGELDVVLVRKLRAPRNPELAIGSIDDHGNVYLDPDTRDLWDDTYLQREIEAQRATLDKRRAAYGTSPIPVDLTGRVAIVVDDGIATGSTMIAALRATKARKPSTLVAAAGVAAPQTVDLIAREADEVVCAEIPPVLWAIGAHFRQFDQVSDEEVIATLRAVRAAAPA